MKSHSQRLVRSSIAGTVAFALAACSRELCRDGCAPQATIDVHLEVSREDLANATMRICRNEICEAFVLPDGGFDRADGGPPARNSITTPGPFTRGATLREIDVGWFGIQAEVTTLDARDGDRISISIARAAAGEPLIEVTRNVVYARNECCTGGYFALYRESRSALTCSGVALCTPGVTIRHATNVGLAALGTAGFEVCRNGRCSKRAPNKDARPLMAGTSLGAALGGEIVAGLGIIALEPFSAIVTFSAYGETAALRNGDVYTARMIAPDGATLWDFSRSVVYAETFPNGLECDLHPCRTAAFDE